MSHLARFGAPDANSIVIRARHNFRPVRADGNSIHLTSVAFQHFEHLKPHHKHTNANHTSRKFECRRNACQHTVKQALMLSVHTHVMRFILLYLLVACLVVVVVDEYTR